MNLSGKGAISGDPKSSTTLNPNAAEFVPSSIKLPSRITTNAEVSPKLASSASLDRSQSLVSNNADEEAHKYWHHQLPDDITPDFTDTGDFDFLGIDNLSLSTLSLNGNEASVFRSLPDNGLMRKDQHLAPHYTNGNIQDPKFRYQVSSYGDDLPLASLRHNSNKPNNDQFLYKVRDAAPYHQKSRNGGFMMNRQQQYFEIADANPLEFLGSMFPRFAVENLAEAYYSNGCNLNSTIEVLRQLEVDGGLNKNVNSKALLSSVHNTMDVPAFSTEDDQIQRNVGPQLFKPGNSIPSGETLGFASAQDTGLWKYESNRSVNANIGSSQSSNILASSFHRGHGSGRAVPAWLETEAVANSYPEMREEVRDHARLRNSYIEQERERHMVGNRALATDLSPKGQLHYLHMKTVHGKAQDSIYNQRNPVSLETQTNGIGRVPERTIDLLGMHIGEALHVLKHELGSLRNAARSVDQIVQVYIFVGSGHQNRSAYTPSRLPIAVQRFLLDEEGLDYTEPQPGVYRVVIY